MLRCVLRSEDEQLVLRNGQKKVEKNILWRGDYGTIKRVGKKSSPVVRVLLCVST